jgi:hypothetical protein
MAGFNITIPDTSGIFDVFSKANTYSNGFYGIGITLLVAVVTFSIGNARGFPTKSNLAFAGFSAFLISTVLWAMGWVSHQFVIAYLLISALAVATPSG